MDAAPRANPLRTSPAFRRLWVARTVSHVGDVGALLALVAASAVLETLFTPAGRSSVPSLVEEGQLLQANAWMGTSLNLQVALGSLIGGALAAAVCGRPAPLGPA